MKRYLLTPIIPIFLLFSACGDTTDQKSSNALVTANDTTNTITNENNEQNTDENVLTQLNDKARNSNSFENFKTEALLLLSDALVKENSFELDDDKRTFMSLLSSQSIKDDKDISSYLLEYYHSVSDKRTTNSIDTDFLKTLIQKLKTRLIDIISSATKVVSTLIKKESNTSHVNPVVANQFQAVWNEVTSDSLETLPQEKVSFFKLFTLVKNTIFEDASRTLSEYSDIRYRFEKLAHPNGVCLKGVWSIDTQNIYSGFFKNGSEALMIARASTAMSNTKKGEIRAFGLAGKLFPTLDAEKINITPSANFFVIDDLGGTLAEYFSDVALTNEPSISTNSEVLKYALYGLKVANAFKKADSNPNIRQLYEVSHLGEERSENNSTIITPKWMKIEALASQTKIDAIDFREEFALEGNETLLFTISVASNVVEGVKAWQQIGSITFDESVISDTCDHRLHFHHPKFRDDLVYQ